jgi:hypothetical protein
MATLTITDLPMNQSLDRQAMAALRGGGAGGWTFGWIRAYVERSGSAFAPIINLYQTNNYYSAEQMNNQIVEIDVQNSGNNSNINVVPKQIGINSFA